MLMEAELGAERHRGRDGGLRASAPSHHSHAPPPGAVDVQVPEEPVVALVGSNATLRCSFVPEPSFDLAQLSLIWQLTDTKQLVHSFAQGRDQGSAYANRTELFPELLAQGNASLRLLRVRVADEGSFTCFVSIRDFGSAAVSLQVAGEHWEGAAQALPQPPATEHHGPLSAQLPRLLRPLHLPAPFP